MLKKLLTIFSLLLCLPATAVPQKNLQAIKTCIAIAGTRGQTAPPSKITVVGESKGFYSLRIGDRANHTYERVIRLDPCKTIYIDQAGETPSMYGIPRFPRDVVDDLAIQAVRYDIKIYGKAQYFQKVESMAKNQKLYLVPELYKALKKEGFVTKNKVILFKIP